MMSVPFELYEFKKLKVKTKKRIIPVKVLLNIANFYKGASIALLYNAVKSELAVNL